jgi:hypothetical protein
VKIPATMETTRKAKKGFIFPQVINKTKSPIQMAMVNKVMEMVDYWKNGYIII